MDREFEIEQIKAAVNALMNHFGKYKLDCDLNWPICFRDGDDMCEVIERGKTTYFKCFTCGHREYSV